MNTVANTFIVITVIFVLGFGAYYWQLDRVDKSLDGQGTPITWTDNSVSTSTPTHTEDQSKTRDEDQNVRRELGNAKSKVSEIWERYLQKEVKELFALSPDSTDIIRRRALDKLFDRAKPKDLDFLYEYLIIEKPKRLSYEEHYANINNILDFLLVENRDIARTESTLLKMLESKDTDKVTKMAIVQRLDLLHQKGEGQEKVENALWQYSTLKDSRIAAVALSTLTRLSIDTTDIDIEALESRIVSILKQDDADELTQVVALQIATWMDIPTVEALAERFLIPEKPSITLQLAAVNTFYKRKNISRLQKLSTSEVGVDDDVKKALMHAIALLNEENL